MQEGTEQRDGRVTTLMVGAGEGGGFAELKPEDERIEAGRVEVDDDAEGDVQVTHPGFEVRNADLRQV